jgi:hypothetical protein
MPELYLPGYNYCGLFTELDKRLTRGDESVNKLDAGCKNHIFIVIIKIQKKDILLIKN